MAPESETLIQGKARRPTGVTLIAAVAFVGGVFGILGGLAAISGVANEPIALSGIVVAFGVLGLALGIGFFTGKGWAWALGLIIYVLSLPLGIWEAVSGGPGSIGGAVRVVVGLVIIYYLTRTHVKVFFGRISTPKSSSQV